MFARGIAVNTSAQGEDGSFFGPSGLVRVAVWLADQLGMMQLLQTRKKKKAMHHVLIHVGSTYM